VAVGDHEEGDLGTRQTFFDHEAVARRPELAVGHGRRDRRFGRRAILRDDDAFARREPVGFEDERPAILARPDNAECSLAGLARHETRRRYVVARHERLRERLARLEPGGGGRRAKQQAPLSRKVIGDAEAERHLWPTTVTSICSRSGESQQRLGV